MFANVRPGIVTFRNNESAPYSQGYRPSLWPPEFRQNTASGSIATKVLHSASQRFYQSEIAEAAKSRNHVIFLENSFDEVRPKIPVGK